MSAPSTLAAQPGRCTLVGAGPGDPELLTLKALKALQAATVVLVDDLVSEAIVALAPPGARIVHVGKRGGCKSTPQALIEQLGGLGYGIVLYANAALQGAVAGMQKALTVLRDTQRIDEDPALVAPFAERQRLVRKGEWDALEKRYI